MATDNHNLDEYEPGTVGWDYNENFQYIDERLPIRDIEDNRGNYTPYPGALFIATDTSAVYSGTGSGWDYDGTIADAEPGGGGLESIGISDSGTGVGDATAFNFLSNLDASVTDGVAAVSVVGVASDNHNNDAHSAAFIADGDGTQRDIYVSPDGSIPAGAAANDIVLTPTE